MTRSSVRVVRAVVIVIAACALAHAQAASDSRLKAALVTKFPQFVEWPGSIAAIGRVTICVGEPDPFGADLNELLEGVTINGRPTAVRRVDRESDVAACQVLFLPTQAGHHPHDLLRYAASRPILTVSDDPSFLDDGGIIQLRVVSGRLRFDVNLTAARQVGLRLSSQLLQLAMTVRGGGR